MARSQGVAWGGNATPGASECLLFAIPQNFVSTFLMDFSSLSLDCRNNLIQANAGGRKDSYWDLLLPM